MGRKSPFKHKVRSHKRNGKAVDSYVRGEGEKKVKQLKLANPTLSLRDVKLLHSLRSPAARRMDALRKAPVAESYEQWDSAPNRYDLPGVDLPVGVSLKGKNINTYSDTVRGEGNKINTNSKEKIIGKKTVLPSLDQIQNAVLLERKDAIKKDLQTQINKLAQLNQTTPQQVIKEKRYSLDDSREIAEQTIRDIMTYARDERDVFTTNEKQIYKEWKYSVRDKRDEIINNVVNEVFEEIKKELKIN